MRDTGEVIDWFFRPSTSHRSLDLYFFSFTMLSKNPKNVRGIVQYTDFNSKSPSEESDTSKCRYMLPVTCKSTTDIHFAAKNESQFLFRKELERTRGNN